MIKFKNNTWVRYIVGLHLQMWDLHLKSCENCLTGAQQRYLPERRKCIHKYCRLRALCHVLIVTTKSKWTIHVFMEYCSVYYKLFIRVYWCEGTSHSHEITAIADHIDPISSQCTKSSPVALHFFLDGEAVSQIMLQKGRKNSVTSVSGRL